MRLRSRLLAPVLLAVFAVGCSSSPSAPGQATPDPGQATQDPGPTVAATEDPGETTEPGAGTPAGNPGEGLIPVIADGLYMTGTIDASFTGTHPVDVDATIVGGASITSGGFTSLMYQVGEAETATTIQLVLDPLEGAAISLTGPTILVAGGHDEGCIASVDRNDASGISGTISCPELPGFVVGSNAEARDSVTATWSADR